MYLQKHFRAPKIDQYCTDTVFFSKSVGFIEAYSNLVYQNVAQHFPSYFIKMSWM